MSEYDKLRAKNIAERNAILAKIFKEPNEDKKPKIRVKVAKKRRVISNHKENKNNNDDDDDMEAADGHEQSENEPPKKRKYIQSATIEKREYNLRVRPARLNVTPESGVSDDDSTINHKRNHRNVYKTRSWYHQREEENDGTITRNYRKKNYLEEEEEMEAESTESSEEKEESRDSQLTVVPQAESTAESTEEEEK